jgi:medium-chain acyl-[acyl-carrier-protein] hydrolase
MQDRPIAAGAHLVNRRQAESRVSDHSKWILKPRPNPAAALRAFFFPYAGLGPSVFRGWVSEFPGNVEVCLMQPPGREGRWAEKPFVSVDALASAATEAMLPHLTIPYVTFGHSLGALVSFEVARRLRRRSAPMPLHQFVSAHRAPQLPNPHPAMRGLADAEFVDQICRQYGGIPQAVLDNPDLMELMLPCLRADLTAYETYEYHDDDPLVCPISAFGGRLDTRVSEEEVRGWREQTRESFNVQMFDGGHFFLQTHRDELLAAIRRELGALRIATAGRR